MLNVSHFQKKNSFEILIGLNVHIILGQNVSKNDNILIFF